MKEMDRKKGQIEDGQKSDIAIDRQSKYEIMG